ncbi:hypothetical protein [Sunxiuqinia sp. sy24]|uniref:hypothetical protein n=1 Tax=Sunxiuqinia sp. sy24 TaxID=3461495 RepID=UPI004046074D
MQKLSLFFLLFILSWGAAFGQSNWVDSLHTAYDQRYGLDMLLHNGEKYTSDVNPVKGHPFWRDDHGFVGDIYIKGEVFKTQNLRYDLNKQEFILNYIDYNQQTHQIVLNSSVIDSVRTDGICFISHSLPEIPQRFVQLVFEGQLICYISRKKDLNFESQGSNIGYHYTGEIKNYYLVFDDAARVFNRKGNFLKLFPKENRKELRTFLSSRQIDLKKITEKELKDLIAYCERIIQ